MFPADETYRVGQCASGWIPFSTEAEPAVRHAAPDREPRQEGIGEGTFIVGEDVQPGRYKAKAADGNCYWARLKDDSGELDSIIANNNTAGQSSVTIKATDGAFETSGCTPWIRQP
jgi:hypothetical protein